MGSAAAPVRPHIPHAEYCQIIRERRQQHASSPLIHTLLGLDRIQDRRCPRSRRKSLLGKSPASIAIVRFMRRFSSLSVITTFCSPRKQVPRPR
jgi:hypothetical protein